MRLGLKDFVCPILVNQPNCLHSAELWGVLRPGDRDKWVIVYIGHSLFGPHEAWWGRGLPKQSTILNPSFLPSGVGLVSTPCRVLSALTAALVLPCSLSMQTHSCLRSFAQVVFTAWNVCLLDIHVFGSFRPSVDAL